MGEPVRDIVIVGGGTAGWITAALLGRRIDRSRYRLVLVESPGVGTIGVGEATVPTLVAMLRGLGIDEDAFMRHCQATYKLSIRFEDWDVEPFWRAYRQVSLPASLREILDLYERTGLVRWPHPWLFRDISFCAIAGGLLHLPPRWPARTDFTDPDRGWQVLNAIKARNAEIAQGLPDHLEFIDRLNGQHRLAPGQTAAWS